MASAAAGCSLLLSCPIHVHDWPSLVVQPAMQVQQQVQSGGGLRELPSAGFAASIGHAFDTAAGLFKLG